MSQNIKEIKDRLAQIGFLQGHGAWVLVDGQFGSTGKGLAASVLAECFGDAVDCVTSNAGPNSGHTSYHGDTKIVLQQLPSFAVWAHQEGTWNGKVFLNAGAIIDVERLTQEIADWDAQDWVNVSAYAAKITDRTKADEKHLIGAVGSTGKGTGAALAAKILRDPEAVTGSIDSYSALVDGGANVVHGFKINPLWTTLVEVSQGYSLSLNASGMYPYTTSRDCTVAQAMSDAGLHPLDFVDSLMVVRTYPIRVAGNSGPCYPDQTELTWDELGQTPEITTVTKKVRRVFTWSKEQFKEALRMNRPSVLFVNFMNYLPEGTDHDEWLDANVYAPYYEIAGAGPRVVLLGYGATNDDVVLHKRATP